MSKIIKLEMYVVDIKMLFFEALAFMIIQFAWEFYLSLRQHKVYKKNTRIPTELIGIIDKKTFEKARLYAMDKNKFNMTSECFTVVCNVAFICLNGLPYSWNLAERAAKYLGYPNNEVVQSAACVGMLNFVSALSCLPFSIYYTFVLEERHGFNKQTAGFFIKDKIKVHILQQLLIVPIMCGIVYIVRIGGEYFFVYLWLFVTIVTLLLYTIYPDYIAPLFDKYTPLPEGELKREIERLAKSVNFPLYKIYVVEGSRRSAHSNAYFYGLFNNKRIVLFDTLLKDYPSNADDPNRREEGENNGDGDEEERKREEEKKKEREKKGCDTMEVLAVLGHELGHWKLNHVVKNLIIVQTNLFFIFFVFGNLFRYQPLYMAFGFNDSTPVLIGLVIVFHFVCLPYFEILNFLVAILSRHFEFQADNFAKSLGRAHFLKMALIKLNSDNLGFPIYDPWYSKWHHSHPPLLERLQALDKID